MSTCGCLLGNSEDKNLLSKIDIPLNPPGAELNIEEEV